tara:strand:- start:522 stop:1022 length:501 start_codon:yes stop_codon:yes gene_type:complete
MQIVVHTQFSENYGAHDWDGTGECPQYWKQKGGSTYVVTGVTVEKAADKDFWSSIDVAVEHFSEYSSERVIGTQLIDDIDFNVRDHLPEWETPIYLDSDLEPEEPGFTALQTTENDEFQTMRPEIRRMYKRWTQVGGEVKNNQCSFEFVDGNILPYKDSLDYMRTA